MHMVKKRSVNGSVITLWKISCSFNQQGEQFHIKKVLANLYQHNGHNFLEFASSKMKEQKNHRSIYSDFSKNFELCMQREGFGTRFI